MDRSRMNLTETIFWEDYWRNRRLPSEVDMQIPFDRCLADALTRRLKGVRGDAFEVGCAQASGSPLYPRPLA